MLINNSEFNRQKFYKFVRNKLQSLVNALDNEEYESSATLHMFLRNPKLLSDVLYFLDRRLKNREKLVDFGGGFGFLTKFIAEVLGFKEAYNIDIDVTRLERSHVTAIKCNLEYEILPFKDNEIDLVISFGVLDHMVFWDNFFIEAARILKPNHYLVVSLTNLGSWDSRISLLLGYQPRHVEVSKKYLVGVHPFYNTVPVPVGHIHTCTYRAIVDLAARYGFKICYAKGLKTTHPNLFVKFIDTMLSRRASLATRYIAIFELFRK
jgi:SAM-dependent methyltransferase